MQESTTQLSKLLDRPRKELGIYYTPHEAARILCEWAIRDANDRILEPSFGACGFLEAAKNRLRDLGAVQPMKHLFGCDIDKLAFSHYLEPKFQITIPNSRFLHRDFLSTYPSDFNTQAFNVALGNPPYVSYHNMSKTTRLSAERIAILDDFLLTPKASLWAYFVLHTISFLQPEGRMAWILPSSFLFADYANTVREYIAQNFRKSLIVQLRERLFLSEGTEELTVVLLADGKQSNIQEAGRVDFNFANTLDELKKCIHSWGNSTEHRQPIQDRIGKSFLSEHTSKCMEDACAAGRLVTIGDIAEVRIGIVTGANPFFIINNSTAQAHGLDDSCLRPILAKFSIAPGGMLTSRDLELARAKDRRCLLLNTECSDITKKKSPVRCYLATMPRSVRRSVATFRKRTLWHQPDDGRIPNAFFPYMYHNGPRLILNEAHTTSTNTIHRVYFKPNGKPSEMTDDLWQKACAISILSTYSQLSGEIQGRCYGAGVLKHEPSEACRIQLILPHKLVPEKIRLAFRMIDESLRRDDEESARKCANEFVLGSLTENKRKHIVLTLEGALAAARHRRRRQQM